MGQARGEGMMAYVFPSDGWIRALQDELNRNERYVAAAKGVDVRDVFVVEGEVGTLEETKYLYKENAGGPVVEACEIGGLNEKAADYVYRAKYSVWKRLVRGELDLMSAVQEGKMEIIGDVERLMTMVSVEGIVEFVESMKKVDTVFIDELA